MKFNYLKAFLSLSLLSITLVQCKKDKSTDTTATREQLTMDSIFLYAKEIYLWNDALPSYASFNPRSYTSYGMGLAPLEKELFRLSQYKINSSTGKPYEYSSSDPTSPKYSYIDDKEASGATAFIKPSQSYVELDGAGTDFGIGIARFTATDIRISYVNASSPASAASLSRGDKIVSINGRTTKAETQTDVDYINNAFNASGIKLVIQKLSGTTVTINLTQATYSTSPVIKKAVIEKDGKKIGYLVFARFSTLSNAQSDLDAAFADFATAGVTDLVIDLRYNGGGYVSTAEYLINLIAPPSLNGKTMYSAYYNDMMKNGNAKILQHQPFYDENHNLTPYKSGINGKFVTYADLDYSVSGNTYSFGKKGSLNGVKNVCFIVSGKTASASELTINALKPYLNVKLVGSTTYGKPVGFFGIDIDKYTVYMSNFQTKNANGEGGYFTGMTVDIPATDDLTRDFGDQNEDCLAKALKWIITGVTTTSNTVTLKNGTVISSTEVNPEVIPTQPTFTGMVENRYKLK